MSDHKVKVKISVILYYSIAVIIFFFSHPAINPPSQCIIYHALWVVVTECLSRVCQRLIKSLPSISTAHTHSFVSSLGWIWNNFPRGTVEFLHYCVHHPPEERHSGSLWCWEITFVYLGSTREDYTSNCSWLYLQIIAVSDNQAA